MDPRLLERRKAVAEDTAQRNVGRLLKFMTILVVVGALTWLAFSPWLSVSQVRTAGIHSSNAHETLVLNRVVAGTPMIMLRPEAVEQILEMDPWIRSARVHREWPNEVIVRVDERIPVAWFHVGGNWALRDIEGVAVPGPDTPDDAMAWVELPEVAEVDADTSVLVLGAAEFVLSLGNLAAGTTLRVESGELWAEVEGHQVLLGRPVEMAAKARSLMVLLREPLPESAVLILIAPTHPAVQPPGGLQTSDDGEAGEDQAGADDSESQDSSGETSKP
jgi:cell division protein FtsQ